MAMVQPTLGQHARQFLPYVAVCLSAAACSRAGYDLHVRDAGDGESVGSRELTIDTPTPNARVASFFHLGGKCRSGVPVSVTSVTQLVVPDSVMCLSGQYDAPISVRGEAGPRSLVVRQAAIDGTEATATLTVQFEAAGINAPSGFERAPVELWPDLLQPGRLYVVGPKLYGNRRIHGLARMTAAGGLDETFAVPEPVVTDPEAYYAIGTAAVEPISGAVFVGGTFTTLGGEPRAGLAKLSASGQLDPVFAVGAGFAHSTAAAEVVRLLLDAARERLYAVGVFTTYDGHAAPGIARLNATTGALDASFQPGSGFAGEAFWMPPRLAVDLDGRLLVAGAYLPAYNGVTVPQIVRILETGAQDTSFDLGSGPLGTVWGMALDTTGRGVYLGGNFVNFAGADRGNLVHVLESGAVDTGFFATGWQTNGAPGPMVIGPGGEIYAGAACYGCAAAVVKLLPTGAAANDFAIGTGNDGRQVDSLWLDANAGYLYAGSGAWSWDSAVADELLRLDLTGQLDASYNAPQLGFNNDVTRVLWDAGHNALVVAGAFTRHAQSGLSLGHIARLHSDGSYDAGFSTGLGFDEPPRALAYDVKADRYLAGGGFVQYDGHPVAGVVALRMDGSLDTSFTFPDELKLDVMVLLPDADGGILVGGRPTLLSPALRRLSATGEVDTSFDVGSGLGYPGFGQVNALAWDPTRRELYVGGRFAADGGVPLPSLVRMTDTGSVDATFVTTLDPETALVALAWEPVHERVMVLDVGGVNWVLTREGLALHSVAAFQLETLCVDPDLGRLYGHDATTGLFVARDFELNQLAGFHAGRGPDVAVTTCAVDPVTHDVYLGSALRLASFETVAVQGLVRMRSDGSLAP